MAIHLRRKSEIFRIDGEWFTGYWHFSFDRYWDPENTQFGTLRVFNVDTLIPGAVWPLHPHRDIEVITYCADGQFQHGDQNGRDGVLEAGDVQHTTVGRGLWHEEVNYSKERPMTFIQVWILPERHGLEPSMEQRHVRPEERQDRFLLLVSSASPETRGGVLPIRQDARAYAASVSPGKTAELTLKAGYGAYFYVISGRVRLNGHEMSGGDAAKVTGEPALTAEGIEQAETFTVVVRV